MNLNSFRWYHNFFQRVYNKPFLFGVIIIFWEVESGFQKVARAQNLPGHWGENATLLPIQLSLIGLLFQFELIILNVVWYPKLKTKFVLFISLRKLKPLHF